MHMTQSDCSSSRTFFSLIGQQQENDISWVTSEVPHQVPSTFR